jgi:sugar lactone lactonase YvrE/ribosomal protein L40E
VNALTGARERVTLERQLFAGGEGAIFSIRHQPNQVAKIFLTGPRPGYHEKLTWMVERPPTDPEKASGHAAIAWPQDLLYNAQGKFIGYVMPHIQNATSMLQVFNPRLRAQTLPGFSRKYLHRVARNLAVVLSALHARDYIIGDLSESNILVTPQALVTLIDTDSFQVRAGDLVYACPVGKVEYTAPELQDAEFRKTVRLPEHDAFALAVLIFQLLLEGSHPYRAQWRGDAEPPTIADKIRNGWYPFAENLNAPVAPPPDVSLAILHPPIVELLRACFVDGQRAPRKRPTPDAWARVLDAAERAMIQCRAGHFYSGHLAQCPECARTAEPAPAIVAPPDSLQARLATVAPASKPGSTFMQKRVAAIRAVATTIVCPQCGETNSARATECKRCATELGAHRLVLNCEQPVNCVAFSPDGAYLAVGCEDGAIQLWRAHDRTRARVLRGHSSSVESVAFAPDGMLLASASRDGAVRLWWVADGTLARALTEHVGAVEGVAFSLDGTRVASVGWDAKARVWQATTGALIKTFKGHSDWVLGVAISPDGALLATASRDTKVVVWNIATGAIARAITAHTGAVQSIAFSPSGALLATGSWDKSARVWQTASGALAQNFSDHQGAVWSVAFSPDGALLATGDFGGTVRVYHLNSGALIKTFSGHKDWARSVAFAPDGKILASASKDKTVRLWELEN